MNVQMALCTVKPALLDVQVALCTSAPRWGANEREASVGTNILKESFLAQNKDPIYLFLQIRL